MKRLWRYEAAFMLLILLTIAGTGVTSAQEQKGIRRWVSGSVVATDTKAIPNTIVITAKNWKGEDLTVGAQVHGDTEITINGRPASLFEIKAGDNVSLVYLREPTRLVAKSIEVKRR